MTEEEKAKIEEEARNLLGEFPDKMSVGMARKIATWNMEQDKKHGNSWIRVSAISSVNIMAGLWRLPYEKLTSEDLDEASNMLENIIGPTLFKLVGRDDDLKRYFCIYVYALLKLDEE